MKNGAVHRARAWQVDPNRDAPEIGRHIGGCRHRVGQKARLALEAHGKGRFLGRDIGLGILAADQRAHVDRCGARIVAQRQHRLSIGLCRPRKATQDQFSGMLVAVAGR